MYCRSAESAFGNTSQLVGTIRIQWPEANSSTTKISPLASHKMSSDWCSHRLMLIFLPPRFGVQNAGGFCWVRTW